MTSNQERAAEIIGQHVKCGWSICDRRRQEDGTLPPLDVCENIGPSCRDVAEGILYHLAAADLLAPELPRPDRDGRWWPQAASIGNVNVNPAGEVVLHSGNFRDMQLHLSPAKARDLAAILTAAAAHAEKENES